jgi:hypothetical protein
MSIIFNPPRPTVTDDIIRAAAASIAEQLDGDVEDIVDQFRPHMDSYQLAKDLESYCGWDISRDDIDVLDGVPHNVEIELKKAQVAWVEANNILPPYPNGTHVRCPSRNATGVIDGIYEYSPATYYIKPDGQDDEKTNHCRWVIKFEKVELVDQEVV